MDVLSLTGLALSASLKTQGALGTETQRLSSGLRVNTAADDPSGLAIAESLASKVHGLDQGVQEIQNAGNALTVAEGAMSTISAILQRMRALVVEGRSDLLSTSDKNDLQAELDQLRLEIDRIAQSTSFNGRNLLDGSASSSVPQPPRTLLVSNPTASGGGQIYDQSVDPNAPYVAPTAQEMAQSISIDSFDPVTGLINITITLGSQDGTFGPTQTVTVQVPNGSNTPLGFGPPIPGTPTFVQQSQNGTGPQVLGFNIGTLTSADVGKEGLLVTLPGQQKAPGSALMINTGDAEGAVLSVDIPGMSSVNLGVNEVILGDDLQNQAAEYRIDYAINTLGNVRAQVGAQTVALQEAANNGNVASVNTQASESAIRDLNVGSAVTAFTRDQIQNQFQTKLVADSEHLSEIVATLVSDSIVH
ncbi:MAG: flagellin [Candidatus Eremiobacteraeota bacterium]|nr:flagellin [Candidatus Eremiobacteraeota bacterium]MBV8644367.1 flagellin [Candidatus Eremiobacteraeota bacterium]